MTRCLILTCLLLLMLAGPVTAATYHVDPRNGNDNDNAAGSADHPWRTIAHALDRLAPGDTLLLRGGRYREQVRCSLVGTAEQPIVIRAAGDEPVIIDAGLPEFFDDPAGAWEPVEGDLYRSTRSYRNITDAAGAFGFGVFGDGMFDHHPRLVENGDALGHAGDELEPDHPLRAGLPPPA